MGPPSHDVSGDADVFRLGPELHPTRIKHRNASKRRVGEISRASLLASTLPTGRSALSFWLFTPIPFRNGSNVEFALGRRGYAAFTAPILVTAVRKRSPEFWVALFGL